MTGCTTHAGLSRTQVRFDDSNGLSFPRCSVTRKAIGCAQVLRICGEESKLAPYRKQRPSGARTMFLPPSSPNIVTCPPHSPSPTSPRSQHCSRAEPPRQVNPLDRRSLPPRLPCAIWPSHAARRNHHPANTPSQHRRSSHPAVTRCRRSLFFVASITDAHDGRRALRDTDGR